MPAPRTAALVTLLGAASLTACLTVGCAPAGQPGASGASAGLPPGGAAATPSHTMPGMSMMPGMTMAPEPDATSPQSTSTPSIGDGVPTDAPRTLAARPTTMPKKAGRWRLEEHPDANTWHYHGPEHMTLRLVKGDLTKKLSASTGVQASNDVPCIVGQVATDCFWAYPGGYVDVQGLADAPMVREFITSWAAALG